MSPIFRHGAMRLYLLKLLDEQPRHGYEVISLLEDKFLGFYSPSAGTIYPRLAKLESEGLVEHEEAEGRKVYRLTAAGREELAQHLDELRSLEADLTKSVTDLAKDVRSEVRSSVRELRDELKAAAREVRRESRVHARRDGTSVRYGFGFDEAFSHIDGLRDLGRDLSGLVRDVLSAARGADPDDVEAAREVLRETRRTVLATLHASD